MSLSLNPSGFVYVMSHVMTNFLNLIFFRFQEFKFALSQGSNQVNSRDDDCLFPTTDSSMVILPGADFQWFEENGSVASVSSVYGETDYIESIDSDSAALNANILLGHTLFGIYFS